jgi:stage III sporulation protein SpoIIIAA
LENNIERKRKARMSELELFLKAMPLYIVENLSNKELIEVALDIGRPAEIRYFDSVQRLANTVTKEDIEFVLSNLPKFDRKNRTGIDGTLHRISVIEDKEANIVGLTCRVGRDVCGAITLLYDIIASGKNILIVGAPGVGKTVSLRETARVLGDSKRVIVVDTSNEIAGEGTVPHPAIGNARRMQIPRNKRQYKIMIEAVENHTPEVIIIDEIGEEEEAFASRTISERGVQLVGTAHGKTLDNILFNPALSDLVGGISYVTLSDEEALKRSTQKAIMERKGEPTFDVVVEIVERGHFIIHKNVKESVDLILQGKKPKIEIRKPDGKVTKKRKKT